MQGVEGQIFGPMARTYAYALAGALIATFTVTPVLASLLLPEHVKETETLSSARLHRLYNPALRFALAHRAIMVGIGVRSSRWPGFCSPAARQRVPAASGGRATSGFGPRCP